MFEKELQFFITNQDALVKKYLGKILTIENEKVIGVFDTPLDAYLSAQRNDQLGKVMIQPCQEGPGAYTVSVATLSV